jgi:TnpA family transposase
VAENDNIDTCVFGMTTPEIHTELQVDENWNSGNEVIYYGKDVALTGPDREHIQTSMLALHML